MIDLREYKSLIKQLLASENEKDPNWKWSIKSIGKKKVLIQWGYLDYLEEQYPKNCFSITTEKDKLLGDTVTWRHPTGDMMSFATIGFRPGDNARTIEEAIKLAVSGISSYAHTRY